MDIYFDDNYGKLYEESEGGSAEIFRFKCEYGKIKHQFIRREIPVCLSDNKKRYDLITPYGYGGPIVTSFLEEKRSLLCREFEKAFKLYCLENDIVSEFVRFHPIVNNADDFKHLYNATVIRETLGTNLKDYDDPVQQEFTKSCRSSIRRAINRGVTARITIAPASIAGFIHIYHSTLSRNKAASFYFFNEEYFENVIRLFRENVLYAEALYNSKVIAAGLYFTSNGWIHEHLLGTYSEYLSLAPTYVLRYEVANWGKKNRFNLIHYGGGTTNSVEDTLYLFKKQFSINTRFRFSIGRKIWDEASYIQLCKESGAPITGDFFPMYRMLL